MATNLIINLRLTTELEVGQWFMAITEEVAVATVLAVPTILAHIVELTSEGQKEAGRLLNIPLDMEADTQLHSQAVLLAPFALTTSTEEVDHMVAAMELSGTETIIVSD